MFDRMVGTHQSHSGSTVKLGTRPSKHAKPTTSSICRARDMDSCGVHSHRASRRHAEAGRIGCVAGTSCLDQPGATQDPNATQYNAIQLKPKTQPNKTTLTKTRHTNHIQ